MVNLFQMVHWNHIFRRSQFKGKEVCRWKTVCQCIKCEGMECNLIRHTWTWPGEDWLLLWWLLSLEAVVWMTVPVVWPGLVWLEITTTDTRSDTLPIVLLLIQFVLLLLLLLDDGDGLLDCFVANFVSPLMLIALLPPSIRIMGTSVVYDDDSEKGRRRKGTVTREEGINWWWWWWWSTTFPWWGSSQLFFLFVYSLPLIVDDDADDGIEWSQPDSLSFSLLFPDVFLW